ncbi:MAG: RepB family protein [Sedimenticola sp.]
MKDPDDPGTIDVFPAKIGRPCMDPHKGPMSNSERQRRYRIGRKVIQFRVTEDEKRRLDEYCRRSGLSRDELLSKWIQSIDA